ncbi:MAG: GNAT family N-acetyltransferase [Desulfobacterales bacterium]|nr:GNAT family N-acetyltransferase [Desulfobacterales bacterium]
MRVLVLHQAVSEKSSPDDKDVLLQAEAVSGALASRGIEPVAVPCDLNLSALQKQFLDLKPDAAFNLVESLDGCGRLLHLVPALLEAMGIPFTGSDSRSLLATTHKTHAKAEMIRNGLPTPEWTNPFHTGAGTGGGRLKPEPAGTVRQWIVKSAWEHASIGLDEDALVGGTRAEMENLARSRAPRLGGEAFAEAFIEGREFNLSLLQDGRSVQVLVPAEIVFDGYAEGKPRIVDYKAKWETDSYEYHHTSRRFVFPEQDAFLLERLRHLAVRCWEVFGLNGYARVDFRVDPHGAPWILEVNANPCISPDAGFAAALAEQGIAYDRAIERILAGAVASQLPDAERKTDSRVEIRDPVRAGRESRPDPIVFDSRPVAEDLKRVRSLAEATNFFYPAEVDVAEELVQECLDKGDRSGYFFVFARKNGQLSGYGCYGPVACTVSSYDLYWIAVHPDVQAGGLGRRILTEMEQRIRQCGGTRLYAETSDRPQYASTRAFYQRCGFRIESVMDEFYGPGDGRVIYGKILG